MVRYFYVWLPLVIVGTVVLLSAPWLALIALMVAALAALAALAWAILFVPYAIGRAVSRRWHWQGALSHPAFENSVGRSLADPVLHISSEGGNR